MPFFMELKDDRSEKIHYNDTAYPIFIRRGALSDYPNYTAPSHWHDDIELIAILDGQMNYNVNGEIITLQKGEGIFVNARQIHFGFSISKTECDFICILLHPMLLCAVPAYEHDFVLPVIRSNSVPFVFLDPKIHWQETILEQIYYMEQNKGQKTTPLKVQSAFFVIWSLLYENIQPENHIATTKNNDLTAARNMVGFIQKNYTRKISLKEIALAGAVGQSKCCKLFAKYFGQTPNTYLNQYRLNKSLEILKNSDMSVTEIALSVGFSGASYYTEIFRKYFGKSPTEFRKAQSRKIQPSTPVSFFQPPNTSALH